MNIRRAIASKLIVPVLVVGGITTASWIALLAWGAGKLLGPVVIDALTVAAAAAGQ